MEDIEAEGVDQSNQKVRGYKGVQPTDYTVSETPLINVVEDDEPTKIKRITMAVNALSKKWGYPEMLRYSRKDI